MPAYAKKKKKNNDGLTMELELYWGIDKIVYPKA